MAIPGICRPCPARLDRPSESSCYTESFGAPQRIQPGLKSLFSPSRNNVTDGHSPQRVTGNAGGLN